MKTLINQLSLITGGSSGIGLALAKKLAARGANVWILARDQAKLDTACAEISASRQNSSQQVGSIAADITNLEQVSAALERFSTSTGVPNLLVNCAGFAHPGYFAEMDLDIFRATMDINYFGTLYVTKALLPGMIERRSGHIVNISSLAGLFGIFGYSAYGPSKFAIRGLSDIMRYELKEHGIRVSVVFPPDTQTPQLEYERPYKPPMTVELDKSSKVLSADAVASAILEGIIRERYIITPGFDSTLFYHLTNFFGIVYPAMDFMIALGRRSLRSRANPNGAANDDRSH
jgi:3-dehydrosphinganine reductase